MTEPGWGHDLVGAWLLAVGLVVVGVAAQEGLAHLDRRARGPTRPGRAVRPPVWLDISPLVGVVAALLLPVVPAIAVATTAAAYGMARTGFAQPVWIAVRVGGAVVATIAVALVQRALAPLDRAHGGVDIATLGYLLACGALFGAIVHLAAVAAATALRRSEPHKHCRPRPATPRPAGVVTLVSIAAGLLLADLLASPWPWAAAWMALIAALIAGPLLDVAVEQGDAIDTTTGLRHSSAWLRDADRLLRQARGHYQPMGLIAIDIDAMRTINERWGAKAGDRAIAAVAGALSTRHRLVGRLGGEEFAVLAPLAGRAPTDVARAILDTIAALRIELPGTAPLRLTASAGCAAAPVDGTTAQELLVAADHALRIAKTLGPGGVAGAPTGHDTDPVSAYPGPAGQTGQPSRGTDHVTSDGT